MSSTEQRLRRIEDRHELRELLRRYTSAVDTLSDLDGLLGCYTPDAVADLSPIGLPVLRGHGEIRGFFASVFADMTHHAHFASNFAVEKLDGDTAVCTAYVIGMGRNRGGSSVLVYVKYFLDCVRTAEGWKFTHFSEAPLMPLPESLDEIHGGR